MSEATLYHSVVREEIKSQCKVCEAYNLKHYVWCSEAGFGGK